MKKPVLNCRACDANTLKSIIPLGELPLANALLASSVASEEFLYNLEIMLCETCGLAQLRDLIDPSQLFSEYVYFSSNSDTMLNSVAQLVERLIPHLPNNAHVIEIASNDGYLLKNYIKHHIEVLGIDPAKNIAEIANENGISTLCDFFSEAFALKLVFENKQADIIHANNVMAHVPDINGFVKGIKHLLKPNGFAVIEVPYFLDLVQKLEFDTIYHEHVFYFSVKPLKMLFERHGLQLFDIEKIEIHGGTLRLFLGHKDAHSVKSIIEEMITQENALHLYELATFESFMKQLAILKSDLLVALTKLKESGQKIAAYGASAKGTTLLNYFGINQDYLHFVVDKSTVKQGLYTPGTRLPIKNPDALIVEKVNHALLLAWNFAEEIIGQQQDFIRQGGNFIFPLEPNRALP